MYFTTGECLTVFIQKLGRDADETATYFDEEIRVFENQSANVQNENMTQEMR